MGGWCWSAKNQVSESNPDEESRPQKSRIDSKDKAILDLKRRKRDCEAYIRKMELKIAESLAVAKKASKSKDMTRALFAVKLKKMYEKTKEKMQGAAVTLDKSISGIEQARMDVDVYQALKEGDAVLKEVRSKVTLQDFEEVYDNQQERNQVTEYLANSLGAEDEHEYAEDLQKLEDKLNGVDEVQIRLEGEDLRAPTGKLEPTAAAAVPAKKVPVQAQSEEPAEEEEKKELVPA